nr:hypothetical transcript [Hymenolepis microstoma]
MWLTSASETQAQVIASEEANKRLLERRTMDELFKRYGFYGDAIQIIQVPENMEFICQTPKSTSTEEYDIEEDGFMIHVPPKI